MVPTSSNTTEMASAKLNALITSAKEQKHGDYNDIFFDRKSWKMLQQGLNRTVIDNFTKYRMIML